MDIAVIYDTATQTQLALIVTTDGPQALDAHRPPPGAVKVILDAQAYKAGDRAALAGKVPAAVADQVLAARSLLAKPSPDAAVQDATPVSGNVSGGR